MNRFTTERLAALREVMRRENLDAFIIPSTDPHNGEYVPPRWEARKWLTGFDGSAGTAVVTADEAALWTDSRYFLAAAEQLEGTGIVLMKDGMPDTPDICKWLGMKLSVLRNPAVGLDGAVNTAATVKTIADRLRAEGGITLRTNIDPFERIWRDRPQVPQGKVWIHPVEYAGDTCMSKLGRIRARLSEMHVGGMLVSALDDIAWTLNLRGNDVHCNPVFVSYLLIERERATIYINKVKLTADVEAYLSEQGIDVEDYDMVSEGLRRYEGYNILIDENATSHALYSAVRCVKANVPSPVPYMKAVKNAAEIEGFRRAMVRDGVAMVRFLSRLLPSVREGGQTELSVSRSLETLRSEQDDFRGISFDTISAYGEHGAVVHYEPTPDTDLPLRPEGLLLIDSGAQYADGTTDITRTVALGDVTDEERRVYTLVLKGHIRLQMLKFPRGASGTQLDAVARCALWSEGMNFMHGTGHGVGSYLCVHEGPHQIRMEWKPAPIVEGMTVTDEPGMYLAGRFGVRIENMLLAVPYVQTEFGSFLRFETLTLCPIDTAPVVTEMLSADERAWLNGYHKTVYDKLSPLLDDNERAWLKDATAAI
ncbi:aminopeptidase P family protein [Prevotella sp. PCHR]|uniref:Aminopeptidase P family protein n=1 Tax=Xylanibacter caecicola TaxID=2736294 RepID=A0ABX2B3A1_9BACT|nr:aminopeptidase P family protein [Xylanibacter caecicola]NPE24574.1 aminopeptidase P family protein [Xylanibacter caecicola]